MNFAKHLFYVAIVLLGTNTIQIFTEIPQENKIKLTSGMIKVLDGKPRMLDGENLLNMNAIKREVIKLQIGVENPETKKREGYYKYNNKLCSLHTLALYEKELEAQFEINKKELDRKHITRSSQYQAEIDALETHLKQKLHEELLKGQEHIRQTLTDELMYEFEEERLKLAIVEQINIERECQHHAITRKHTSNTSAYDKEFQSILQEHRNNLASLHVILEQAKQDFLKITHPFMEQAHGVKGFLLYLIEESCIKRKRWDSFLLQWGKSKDSEEIEIFNSYMNTCQRLDLFCSDLTNFITDVINSCPLGREQAKVLIAEKKQEKNS